MNISPLTEKEKHIIRCEFECLDPEYGVDERSDFIITACETYLEALELIHAALLNDSPTNPEQQRQAMNDLIEKAKQAISKSEGHA